MYQQRQLAPVLHHARASFPAVLLTGPRQSGKATFLRHETGPGVEYISFDDPLERDFAAVDPAGFLRRFADRPVIFDEIQYARGLLSHLKPRIDREPARCGQWLLTGSQQFGLMRDVRQIRNIPDLMAFNQPPWFRNYGKRLVKASKPSCRWAANPICTFGDPTMG